MISPSHSGPDPLSDADLSDAFGFDLDDESWVDRLRACASAPVMGKLGDFELLSELGRGGQGVVFKARQPRTGRIVAVKRLGAGVFAPPAMRSRFEREVEAAAVLDHPNIVGIFGTEVIDGQPLLTMKWIDGVPIDRWANPPGPSRRPVREVLQVFLTVCDAVHHAHQRGVIHRDLKPSNILVDGQDRPYIMDFGLAKIRSEAIPSAILSQTGEFLGTPAYAAPEQIRGDSRSVDVRADVYALGAILYQLLTGSPPFGRARDWPDLMQGLSQRDPIQPSKLDPRLNSEIDAILLKSLAHDKQERYESIDALAADIRRYLAGDAVSAHPPSSAYRVRKFIRHHRASVMVSTAFVFLLMAATITSTAFYLRSEKESARAKREAETQSAISQFVQNMLHRAAPYPLPGNKDITVRDALHAAALEIEDKELQYPPGVEAELRHAIADTLYVLGSIHEAIVIEREALRLSRIAEAAGEPPCLDCYSVLAQMQKELDDYPAAVETLNEALAALHDTPENPSPERPELMRQLGMVRWRQGDFRASERIAREALRLSMEIAPDNAAFVDTMNVVISSLVPNNAPDFEGETMARKTLAYIHGYAPGGLDYAFQLCWLAMLVRERGDLEQAEQLNQEAIRIYENTRGDKSPACVAARFELGLIRKAQGELDEAESIIREVIEFRSKLLGDHNRATIDARVFLATVLHAQGDYQAALLILEEALANYRKRFGVDNIHTVRVEGPLAPVLAAVGRTGEAEQLFRHALAVRRDVLGERGETATNIHELGQFLLDQGRIHEAKPVLQEALTMRRSVRGEDHRETTETRRALMSIVHAQD